MRRKYLLILIASVVIISCKKDKDTGNPGNPPVVPPVPNPPVQPVQTVFLKDLTIAGLPSPFYHFEYDGRGRQGFANYASGLLMYDLSYQGKWLAELRNNVIVNKDRLEYSYDTDARVNLIRYVDSNGLLFKRVRLWYDGQKLIRLERYRKIGADFILEKIMLFTYYADGNLLEIAERHPALGGQNEINFTLRFEQYDNKINTDGFTLIHNEFFEHFVFLPQVQIQKNNPGKLIRSGDGVNLEINYTYTYNDNNAPLTKRGNGIFLTGANAGQQFQTSSVFSYY